MNAHLVLPALEVEFPAGTSPPARAHQQTRAFPEPDAEYGGPGVLPPVEYPAMAAEPGPTTGVAAGRHLAERAPATAGPTDAPAAAVQPGHSPAQGSGIAHPADAAPHGSPAALPTAPPAALPGRAQIVDAATAREIGSPYGGSGAPYGVDGAARVADGASYGVDGAARVRADDASYGVNGAARVRADDASYGVNGAALGGGGLGLAAAASVGVGAFAGTPVASAGAPARAGRMEPGRFAAVGAPRRTGPSRPRSGGSSGRAARWFGVPQIVCWQLAMIVAGLGLREAVAVKIAAGLTALLLLTGVSVRWGGQWLYQWIAHGIRFCLRRRSLRAATNDPRTRQVVPALLAADTWTRTIQLDQDASGPADAVTDAAADAGGLSAALCLPASDRARIDAWPSARDLLDVMEKQPVTMVAQTVLHTGTRPDVPARSWIAVRARRNADLADDTDLEAVLANGLRRVARGLDRLGIEAEPLSGQALPDTLAALAHTSGGRDVLTESWTACRTGPVIQVTYRLARFEQLPHAAAGLFLDHVLHRPERVATTVAVTAWRGPGAATRAEAVLRIAAVNRGALDQAARDTGRLAAEFGVRPERLDGRHRAGVLASLPLGHTTPGGAH